MALSQKQIKTVEDTIRISLLKKLKAHNPEPNAMPFHAGLLGKNRLALYSFIHSLNTNFGTAIFEPIAVFLASSRFKMAKSQVSPGSKISTQAQSEIQKIIDKLSANGQSSDKRKEIEIIRRVCQKGKLKKVKPARVDVYLENNKGEIYLIDLKTAKPNKGSFKEFKRTLLEWVAIVLFEKPTVKVNTLIAIPYNPYAPRPYTRWTMANMLDSKRELKVAKDFWDFLGGSGTYGDLLDCFEKIGIEMKDKIDNHFAQFH